MTGQLDLHVRLASTKDKQKIANLLHFETYVHRHLDWRNPLDWISHQPYLVLVSGNDILAALACPPDPPDISWIRLFAAGSSIPIDEAWKTLWITAREKLSSCKVNKVAVIPLHEWFRQLVIHSRFSPSTQVITLSWSRQALPPSTEIKEITIRAMTPDDINHVASLDTLAFNPIWRNSQSSLEMAFHQAAIATIVECNGLLVGYQISTANQIGGHLARIAIHPKFQGTGIGYALLRDLLLRFERKGASQVTVNTQEENSISLGLYEKAGFTFTGEKYQVFEQKLIAVK